MKNLFILLLFALPILLSSCQKEEAVTTITNDYFVSFDLDGTAVDFRPKGSQYGTAGYNIFDTRGVTNATIAALSEDETSVEQALIMEFNFDKNSTKKGSFEELVGQKIVVGASNDIDVFGSMSYNKYNSSGALSFWSSSTGTENDSPEYYIKINSAVYHQEMSATAGRRIYLLEGEFNLQLSGQDNVVRNASNGKFRMYFPENF